MSITRSLTVIMIFFSVNRVTGADEQFDQPREDPLKITGESSVGIVIKPVDMFRVQARIGYKTDGYVFAQALRQGLFWHFGAGFSF